MKILEEKPPNFEDIKEVFPVIQRGRIIFTYGDTIYNPDIVDLREDLIVHEKVHIRQQGSDPAGWWKKYLTDKNFRFSQELEAYRAQCQYLCLQTNSREKQHRMRYGIAAALSSEIYGKMITTAEAYKLLV